MAGVSRKTSPEGDTLLDGAAGASSHQMDHRPFQVLTAGYRIELRGWPQGPAMVRNFRITSWWL